MNVKQKESEAKPSRHIMGNDENRREFLDLLSVFFTKYLVIFSATYKMFRHPHTFVDHIDESRTGIKRALIYFIESIVLVFVIPPHLLKGERSIGFIEQEFIVVGFAAYIAIIAFTHSLCIRKAQTQPTFNHDPDVLRIWVNDALPLTFNPN